MDLWTRAKVFAEEAAKRAEEAAKRSQELTKGAAKFSQEFVSETAKKSKEFAAEATKAADQIKTEALRRADQIKTLAAEIPIPVNALTATASVSFISREPSLDLEKFGITEELKEFVRGLTISTFKDFPMEEETDIDESTTPSNVRKDLNEWQAKHATLILSAAKDISKFRYELCPRYMKERKFWQIYFILVNNHVAPYEKQYMEEINMKAFEPSQQDNQAKDTSSSTPALKEELKESKLQSKPSTSSTAEQDLDVFLLGDLGSSDEGPDDRDDAFDDDFDKLGGTSHFASYEKFYLAIREVQECRFCNQYLKDSMFGRVWTVRKTMRPNQTNTSRQFNSCPNLGRQSLPKFWCCCQEVLRCFVLCRFLSRTVNSMFKFFFYDFIVSQWINPNNYFEVVATFHFLYKLASIHPPPPPTYSCSQQPLVSIASNSPI
ncbi:hypothetical protein IEQ34_011531 [Dendrobium chrysotoxum]|uniref:BSD domain-containing protein n=1 Tax=Dendrobium chrysotoxum TaxID=161865 RepID=A0AAV7GT45_DENCH|nr:hypothetical protein IEQ34_011531 [Dendrobium chrysotoxum]